MKQENIKFIAIGFVIGAIFMWIINITFVNRDSVKSLNSNRGQMMSADSIDSHFIEQMIPHHEDAITMSKIALTKAQRPEVRELAQNIIDSQSKEIDQMKTWYKEWYGRELPEGEEIMKQHGMMGNEGMHMGMMGDETDVSALENSEDFDRAFVEHMIPHHQMAVMMASMLKNGTDRDEMKKLADDIITAQTNEIDQMREWLRNW